MDRASSGQVVQEWVGIAHQSNPTETVLRAECVRRLGLRDVARRSRPEALISAHYCVHVWCAHLPVRSEPYTTRTTHDEIAISDVVISTLEPAAPPERS